ncbi:MAG: hypothetical protein WD406_08055 [Pseudohongiellaceae bacterium]
MTRTIIPLVALTAIAVSPIQKAEAIFGLSIVSRADCAVSMPWPLPDDTYVFNESISWSVIARPFYLWVYSYHYENYAGGGLSPSVPPNHFMVHDGTYANSYAWWPIQTDWYFGIRAYAGDVLGLAPGTIGNGDQPHAAGAVERVQGDHYHLDIRSGIETYLGFTEAVDCNIFDW